LAVVRAPAHPRHRDARGRRRLEEHELPGTTRLDHVSGWIAPQDQRLATAAGMRRGEQPDLPRGAPWGALGTVDRDVGAAVDADARAEPLGEVSRRDRETPTSRSPRARPSATR